MIGVTHAPQVAARAQRHYLIVKAAAEGGARVVTRVEALDPPERREEIARMLAERRSRRKHVPRPNACSARRPRRAAGTRRRFRRSGLSFAMPPSVKTSNLRAKPVDRLSELEAKGEHAALDDEIAEHDLRYHQEDSPTISDADYDALRRRYEEIETRFPALRAQESRSRRVGAPPSEKFSKVRHRVPMLSLGNAFAEEEVHGFVARVRRFLDLDAENPPAFTAEPKIDGLSCAIRYERGLLARQRRAATARRARM